MDKSCLKILQFLGRRLSPINLIVVVMVAPCHPAHTLVVVVVGLSALVNIIHYIVTSYLLMVRPQSPAHSKSSSWRLVSVVALFMLFVKRTAASVRCSHRAFVLCILVSNLHDLINHTSDHATNTSLSLPVVQPLNEQQASVALVVHNALASR